MMAENIFLQRYDLVKVGGVISRYWVIFSLLDKVFCLECQTMILLCVTFNLSGGALAHFSRSEKISPTVFVVVPSINCCPGLTARRRLPPLKETWRMRNSNNPFPSESEYRSLASNRFKILKLSRAWCDDRGRCHDFSREDCDSEFRPQIRGAADK